MSATDNDILITDMRRALPAEAFTAEETTVFAPVSKRPVGGGWPPTGCRSRTVIDDRQPGKREELQFSNFTISGDRGNRGQIQLDMSLLAIDPEDFWRTGVYRYRIVIGV